MADLPQQRHSTENLLNYNLTHSILNTNFRYNFFVRAKVLVIYLRMRQILVFRILLWLHLWSFLRRLNMLFLAIPHPTSRRVLFRRVLWRTEVRALYDSVILRRWRLNLRRNGSGNGSLGCRRGFIVVSLLGQRWALGWGRQNGRLTQNGFLRFLRRNVSCWIGLVPLVCLKSTTHMGSTVLKRWLVLIPKVWVSHSTTDSHYSSAASLLESSSAVTGTVTRHYHAIADLNGVKKMIYTIKNTRLSRTADKHR